MPDLRDRSQRRVPMSGSQNALILATLGGGGWMSTAQIHRVAGFSRLNSRIAELRSYGYDIPSRHVPGMSGPHGTEYRLVSAAGCAPSSETSVDPARVASTTAGERKSAEAVGGPPLVPAGAHRVAGPSCEASVSAATGASLGVSATPVLVDGNEAPAYTQLRLVA